MINEHPFTERELTCVKLVAEGWTAKEIANKLVVSTSTVEEYLRRACAKVNATNRATLIYKVTKKEWI